METGQLVNCDAGVFRISTLEMFGFLCVCVGYCGICASEYDEVCAVLSNRWQYFCDLSYSAVERLGHLHRSYLV